MKKRNQFKSKYILFIGLILFNLVMFGQSDVLVSLGDRQFLVKEMPTKIYYSKDCDCDSIDLEFSSPLEILDKTNQFVNILIPKTHKTPYIKVYSTCYKNRVVSKDFLKGFYVFDFPVLDIYFKLKELINKDTVSLSKTFLNDYNLRFPKYLPTELFRLDSIQIKVDTNSLILTPSNFHDVLNECLKNDKSEFLEVKIEFVYFRFNNLSRKQATGVLMYFCQ